MAQAKRRRLPGQRANEMEQDAWSVVLLFLPLRAVYAVRRTSRAVNSAAMLALANPRLSKLEVLRVRGLRREFHNVVQHASELCVPRGTKVRFVGPRLRVLIGAKNVPRSMQHATRLSLYKAFVAGLSAHAASLETLELTKCRVKDPFQLCTQALKNLTLAHCWQPTKTCDLRSALSLRSLTFVPTPHMTAEVWPPCNLERLEAENCHLRSFASSLRELDLKFVTWAEHLTGARANSLSRLEVLHLWSCALPPLLIQGLPGQVARAYGDFLGSGFDYVFSFPEVSRFSVATQDDLRVSADVPHGVVDVCLVKFDCERLVSPFVCHLPAWIQSLTLTHCHSWLRLDALRGVPALISLTLHLGLDKQLPHIPRRVAKRLRTLRIFLADPKTLLSFLRGWRSLQVFACTLCRGVDNFPTKLQCLLPNTALFYGFERISNDFVVTQTDA